MKKVPAIHPPLCFGCCSLSLSAVASPFSFAPNLSQLHSPLSFSLRPQPRFLSFALGFSLAVPQRKASSLFCFLLPPRLSLSFSSEFPSPFSSYHPQPQPSLSVFLSLSNSQSLTSPFFLFAVKSYLKNPPLRLLFFFSFIGRKTNPKPQPFLLYLQPRAAHEPFFASCDNTQLA